MPVFDVAVSKPQAMIFSEISQVSEEGVGRVVDEEDDGEDTCVDVEGPAVCWV